MYIYILELTDSKYYVGRTSDIKRRYQEHLEGTGSVWTRKYKPVSLEKAIENVSIYDEDRYVKEYMHKHGIDNVRGGSYSTIELTEAQKTLIKKEIWGATDCCMNCGKQGHFAKTCIEKVDVDGKSLQKNWIPAVIMTFFQTMFSPPRKQEGNCCYRCGRSSHFIYQCYARTHIDGRNL